MANHSEITGYDFVVHYDNKDGTTSSFCFECDREESPLSIIAQGVLFLNGCCPGNPWCITDENGAIITFERNAPPFYAPFISGR